MADYQRQAQYRAALANPNVQRALASIRAAEGTAQYDNPYGTAFGGTQFSDYSQHPGILGSFTDSTGRARKTTAAGAYQMLGRTWNGISDDLGLTDFSPENQDIAAVGLIDRRGALGDVMEGNVPGFASKVRNEWASFPNSPYGQPTTSLGKIQSAWDNYGTQSVPNTGILGAVNRVDNTPLSETNPAAVGPVERGQLLDAPAEQFGPMTQAQDLASQYGQYGLGQLAMQNALAPQKAYVDPQVTTAYRNVPQATSITNAPVQAPAQTQSAGGPLSMSPQEAAMDRANRSYLSRQPQNTSFAATHDIGQMAQKALGSIAGGLLGGAVLGPVGGLLGAYVGKQIASPNGLFGNNSFPSKPQGGPKGDGGLTSYGRSAMQNSPQARSALSNGSSGLF